jgi:hypothetical protein
MTTNVNAVWPIRPSAWPDWRVLVSLLALIPATLAQVPPAQAELRAVRGAVTYATGDLSDMLTADDVRAVGVGDRVDVGSDGEAALRLGDVLQVQVFGSTRLSLESLDDVEAGSPAAYRLSAGTTLNVAAGAALAGRSVEVRTDSAVVSTSDGRILVYQDPSGTTWVVVTDGIGWVSAAEQLVQVPPGFMTWVTPGGPPMPAVAASRALVSDQFPTLEALTSSALADADFFPPPPPAPDPGGVPPASDPAQLLAGNATVWYWAQPTGPLATLVQSMSRDVGPGDQINVSASGDAELRFTDALVVKIYRNSRLQWQAACDASAFLCYRLEAGTVYNTLNSDILAGRRVQVFTNWAVITAVGTEFLVHYDRTTRNTWVVVEDGTAHVSGGGQELDVPAHFQTFVEPAQPPATPMAATRSAIGERFPRVEALTNNALGDVAVLPEIATPTTAPRLPTSSGVTPTSTPPQASTASTPTTAPSPLPTGSATPKPTQTPERPPSDRTAPTIGADVSPAPNASGWNHADVTVTWAVDPGRSGLDSTTGCQATTLSDETSLATITCSATNRAGIKASRSVSVRIDKTAPALQLGLPAAQPNTAGWYRDNVAIPCTASDSLSGIAAISPGCPLVLSAEGAAVSGAVTVTDNAGNTATLTSTSFKIDKTAPVLTVPDPMTVNGNVDGALVTYKASATDNVDPNPVLNCTPASGSQFRTGTTTVTCTASDAAGNSASKTFTVSVVNPTVPVQVSPPNGSVFSNYPRTTTLKWQSVPGAATYTVEVDCFQCCQANAWCTDVGRTYQITPRITGQSFTFDFVGAQPGRWRVWAVSSNGTQGPKSGWWGFRYTI